jgi:hypothetical protein
VKCNFISMNHETDGRLGDDMRNTPREFVFLAAAVGLLLGTVLS